MNEILSQPMALPQGVAVTETQGGLQKVRITRPACSAEISVYGAQIVSWKPSGEDEVLFLSEKSHWTAGKAIRGGIPVCFPWFRAKADNPQAPSHGFARTRIWQIDAIVELDGGVRVSLSTGSDPETERWWPHAFRLEHHITVGQTLTLELTTFNTGDSVFRFEEAQHSYYRVEDVETTRVDGLDGVAFLDNTAGNREGQQTGPVALSGQTDNAYQQTEHTLTLEEPRLGRRLSILKGGSESTVVWNPWQDGAAKLADLGDEEWRQFLCVEAANILGRAVELAPGERHSLVTRVAVER